MPRGGKRQGNPGTGYSNRTDLMNNYDQTQPAAGGTAQPQSQQPVQMPAGPLVGADEVPNLHDPSNRPSEPVTAGLPIGPGAGVEAIGPLPPTQSDPVRQVVEAMMLIAPNPDLSRILGRLDYEGR